MLNVSIVGLGQIGGSLGLALKNKALKNRYHITGISRKQDTLNTALKLKAADEVYLSLDAAKKADIVVICTPVDTITPIYKELVEIVGKDTAITDTGSVKYSIEKDIKAFAKESGFVSFIGSHPMTGREKYGISSADVDMFRNTKVVITSELKQLTKKENLIVKMWKDTGADITKISAKKHDALIAFTSHLPHVIAFLLSKSYKKMKQKNPQIATLTAGSFKSITRVAVSSADMWAPIFALNSENIEKYLDEFIKELISFKKNLKNKQKIKQEILKTQK
ncbi:prephenate dehydrogenase [Endomicrobiia bacterium]|nr:prephenate dehydrogenase [Endomicrobiia bacterium]